MNENLKRAYFARELLRKYPRKPPKRLKRLIFPSRVQAKYERDLLDILAFLKAKVDERVKPMLPGLVEHYGRVRKDEVDQPQKYYAAFIYDKTASDYVLHCTHHYLGELDRDQLRQVEKMIDGYFLKERELPHVAFNQIDYFGPEKDIRVLRPLKTSVADFLPDLKAKLEGFRKDDFPEYKPHVSTEQMSSIDKPFQHYALISKKGIARTWPKTVRIDAADDLQTLADELEQVRLEFTQEYTPEELKNLAKMTGKSVESWNEKQLNGQLSGIVEIDLFGNEPWLAREMGGFVATNVSLIKSISEEYLGQVEKMVATSVRSGLRVEEIAADLEDRFDVSESRARLIARDQVGKFNGQLTEARQKDLGIDGYTWRGVGDARERDSHLLLNNTKQTWDDPPDVGHPGEDIQCRCWAEADLSDFYGDET